MALGLTSCVSDATFRAYVIAHRQVYSVTRPQLERYIIEDATLDEAAKQTFTRLLVAEDEMITNGEKLIGLKQ